MRIQSRCGCLHPVIKQNGARNTVYLYIAAVHQRYPLTNISIAQVVVDLVSANLEYRVADTLPTLTAACTRGD